MAIDRAPAEGLATSERDPVGSGAEGDLRVAFSSFGCRLNQFETDGMRELVQGGRFRPVAFEDEADVYVINTCSVTTRSEAQARQLVRKIARTRAGARILVTGCYAQRAPGELAALPGVRVVFGHSEKEEVRTLLETHAVPPTRAGAGGSPPGAAPASVPPAIRVGSLEGKRRAPRLAPTRFEGRTRATLRVQDGCDERCAFCVIPGTRGRGFSVPRAEVLDLARRLVAEGYRELVVTGTHLGGYGEDAPSEGTLSSLVRAIADLPGAFRVRVSSVEPFDADSALVALAARHPKVARHLHLPVQSGESGVLRAMRRPYDATVLRDLFAGIAGARNPIGVGTDVLVGFPGESEASFEETRRFLEASPVSFFHVFPFSPRPGTDAARLPGPVDDPEKARRSRVLRDLGAGKAAAFRAALRGRVLEVLPEEWSGETARGLASEYVRVRFRGAPGAPAGFRRVLATGVDGIEVVGEEVEA